MSAPEPATKRSLAIRTDALTRRFGDVLAVDAVDLAVPEGGIYGFLGPNGAGKTTTIRMLLGLLRPDGGHIEVLGRGLAEHRREVLGNVGALVEMPSVYDHLSGRDNLEITRRLLGIDRCHIDRVLADGYSLGMRQRLGLALALLAEPELLILDEPTNGLDPAGIREMRELIAELPRRHGVTVFLSSHLLSEIELLADHLGIVRQGRLCFEGTPAELRARRQGWVAVGLDRPDAARPVLAAAGWTLRPTGNGRLHVAPPPRALDGDTLGSRAIGELNALLVGRGFNVFHLSSQRPSLESLFLQMTTAEGDL